MHKQNFQNKSIITLVALALVIPFSGCSHTPKTSNHAVSDFFGTKKVHRYRLANGLKVLILEDHSAPTFAYQTWYKVGSRDEEKGLTGLAHFFEHMMFKETKNFKEGELDRLLESAGAEGENAFTSRDYTGYVQSLPSEKLELIARLESDRMVNLSFKEEALNKEREVVQNERRMRYENSPDGLLYEKIYELAYNKHSYHWPVIGYDKDLREAKKTNFENFYKRFYAPNNATISIVGDIDPDRAIAIIEKYYGNLAPSRIDRRSHSREPEQTTERVETIPIKTPVEKLMVAYHTSNVNSLEFPALEVLRGILTEGKSSRLYRKLVDGGIATAVQVENEEHAEPGLLLFLVNMQKGKTAKQALAVIDQEIKEIVKGKISEEEIERAVSMIRFSLFDSLVSNDRKSHFLGFYETVAGRFERGIDIANAFASIEKRTLRQVAQNHLSRQNRTVVIGVP